MMESEVDKMSFICTDRFGETKTFKLNLNSTSTDTKIYNQELIEKIKEFQDNVNSLMTEFVNKEKDELREIESSQVKTRKSKKDENESEHEDDQEVTDDETENDQKEKTLDESESVKKRQNGDRLNTDLDAKKKCLSD